MPPKKSTSMNTYFKSTKPSNNPKNKQEVISVDEHNDENDEDLNENSNQWSKLYNWALSKMEFDEPLHSQNKSKVDIILRVFDLSYEFGPCVGLSRLERFQRAQHLGLDPPSDLFLILNSNKAKSSPRLRECIFYDSDI